MNTVFVELVQAIRQAAHADGSCEVLGDGSIGLTIHYPPHGVMHVYPRGSSGAHGTLAWVYGDLAELRLAVRDGDKPNTFELRRDEQVLVNWDGQPAVSMPSLDALAEELVRTLRDVQRE